MVKCEKCNKEFPFPWKLRRHLARQKPCYQNSTVTNDTKSIPNDSKNDPNDSIDIPNDSKNVPNDSKTKCEYCNKVFSTQSNKIKHSKKCKMKNDKVWTLENECKVEHKQQECKLQCKYCKKVYSKTGNLTRHLETCKTKEGYIMALTEQKETTKVSSVTNNITNNNNNIQNANTIININVLGQESTEHITYERIRGLLRDVLSKQKNENVYVTSGEAVIAFHKLLREDENNRNIIIPHERRQIAYVKREGGGTFEKEEINKALEESFCNSSKKLNEQMNTVEEKQGGFAQQKMYGMQECTYSMGTKGTKGHPRNYPYNYRAHDVHRIKRGFKIANTRKDEL